MFDPCITHHIYPDMANGLENFSKPFLFVGIKKEKVHEHISAQGGYLKNSDRFTCNPGVDLPYYLLRGCPLKSGFANCVNLKFALGLVHPSCAGATWKVMTSVWCDIAVVSIANLFLSG